MPPSRETIRLPLWIRSAPAGVTTTASAPMAARTRAGRRPRRISAVPRELEAAVVEAERQRDVVGEVAVVNEAGRQPLRLDRAFVTQFPGDFPKVILLPPEIDE